MLCNLSWKGLLKYEMEFAAKAQKEPAIWNNFQVLETTKV